MAANVRTIHVNISKMGKLAKCEEKKVKFGIYNI